MNEEIGGTLLTEVSRLVGLLQACGLDAQSASLGRIAEEVSSAEFGLLSTQTASKYRGRLERTLEAAVQAAQDLVAAHEQAKSLGDRLKDLQSNEDIERNSDELMRLAGLVSSMAEPMEKALKSRSGFSLFRDSSSSLKKVLSILDTVSARVQERALEAQARLSKAAADVNAIGAELSKSRNQADKSKRKAEAEKQRLADEEIRAKALEAERESRRQAEQVAAEQARRRARQRLGLAMAAGRHAATGTEGPSQLAFSSHLAGLPPKGPRIYLLLEQELTASETEELNALLGAGRSITLVTSRDHENAVSKFSDLLIIEDDELAEDWSRLNLSPTSIFQMMSRNETSHFLPEMVVTLSDLSEVPEGGEFLVVCPSLSIPDGKRIAALTQLGARLVVFSETPIRQEVADWIPDSVTVVVGDSDSSVGKPDSSILLTPLPDDLARRQKPSGAISRFSDWQQDFFDSPNRVLMTNPDELFDISDESFAHWAWLSDDDPLIWLKAQDADASEYNEESNQFFIEQAAQFAESLASSSDAYFEVASSSFVAGEITSRFGALMSLRINCSAYDDTLVTRIGIPIGYVTDAGRYLGANPYGRASAAWLGLKARSEILRMVDMSGIESSVTSPMASSGIGQLLSGRGDSMFGPMLIRPWAAVSPSGCYEDGSVGGLRGGKQTIVGSVPTNDAPLCLYAGVELIHGQHAATEVKFAMSALNGISVMADAVHMCAGLADELAIVPYSTP